jgi:hypothetical protein
MSLARNARRTAAVLAALAVGACSDSTAPTIDQIDAQAAAAKVAPVMAVMDQPALESFTSLTETPGLPASTSAAALAAVVRLTNAAAHGRWDPSAPQFARLAARSADVLPPDVRGKLYTYNTTTQQYEGAASTEAPANGARVVLYAWDVLAGRPATPLTPIGYVDLLDESTPTQDRLHVIVHRNQGDVNVMDYAITHSVTTSSESFSIAGAANNGTTTVDFTLSGTMTTSGAATVTFDLSAPSVGFTVHVGANVNEATGQASIGIRLGWDNHTLTFDLSVSANATTGDVTADGLIKFDGMRYVEYSMNYDGATGTQTETFQKANGRPLTAAEFEEIQYLFERALDFDRFWAGLLWPIAVLASPM